jgi:predicted permease
MDKLAKELEDKQGKRMIFVIGMILLFMLVGLVIASALFSAPAEEPEKRALLYVDEVFFVLSSSSENSGSSKVYIEVTTFITNKGTLDAENVEIMAFVVQEDSNLAMDKSTFVVGSISKDKTQISEFSLTMPNNDTYVIKLIILESGKIAVKGSGTVHLEQSLGGRGTRFKTDNDGDDDYALHGGVALSETAFPIVIFLLIGAVLVFIIIIVLKKSSSFEKPSGSHFPPPNGGNNGQVKEAIVLPFDEQIPPDMDEFQLMESEEPSSLENGRQ